MPNKIEKIVNFKKGDKLFYVPVGLLGRGLQRMKIAILLDKPTSPYVSVDIKRGGGVQSVPLWCVFKTQLEAVKYIQDKEERRLEQALKALALLNECRQITKAYYFQLTNKPPTRKNKYAS